MYRHGIGVLYLIGNKIQNITDSEVNDRSGKEIFFPGLFSLSQLVLYFEKTYFVI